MIRQRLWPASFCHAISTRYIPVPGILGLRQQSGNVEKANFPSSWLQGQGHSGELRTGSDGDEGRFHHQVVTVEPMLSP
jgi:hypothetical protein